ncbi:hypothetical protein ACTXT7_012497 [Hymenolepis weldensis]
MVGSGISEEEEEKNVVTVCDKVEFGDGLCRLDAGKVTSVIRNIKLGSRLLSKKKFSSVH